MNNIKVIELLAKYSPAEVYDALYKEELNTFFVNKFPKQEQPSNFVKFLEGKTPMEERNGDLFLKDLEKVYIHNGQLRHLSTGLLCSLDHLDCEAAYQTLLEYKKFVRKMMGDIRSSIGRLKDKVQNLKKLHSLNRGMFTAMVEQLVPIEGEHHWEHDGTSSTVSFMEFNQVTQQMEMKQLVINHEPYIKAFSQGIEKD